MNISQTIDFHKKRNFVLVQIFYEKIECSEKFSKKKITKIFVLKPQSRCKEAVNIWTELRCRQKESWGARRQHTLFRAERGFIIGHFHLKGRSKQDSPLSQFFFFLRSRRPPPSLDGSGIAHIFGGSGFSSDPRCEKIRLRPQNEQTPAVQHCQRFR